MSTMDTGLVCPKCGGRHWWTMKVERQENRIRRRRECRHCGRATYTLEITSTAYHTIQAAASRGSGS